MKNVKVFKPNVDHLVPFNSQIMLINDVAGSENGMVKVLANTDGPPIHTHPIQEEVLHVVEGELEVYRNKKWNTLKAGQQIYIPRNTPHSYRNRSQSACLFEYLITPKGSFSEMMKTFERLAQAKKLTSTKDLKSILYLSMAFGEYKRDVLSVAPPPFVMSLFSGIGKLSGLRLKWS